MTKALLGLDQVFQGQDGFTWGKKLSIVGINMSQMILEGLCRKSNRFVSSVGQSHHLRVDDLRWRLVVNLNSERRVCLCASSFTQVNVVSNCWRGLIPASNMNQVMGVEALLCYLVWLYVVVVMEEVIQARLTGGSAGLTWELRRLL